MKWKIESVQKVPLEENKFYVIASFDKPLETTVSKEDDNNDFYISERINEEYPETEGCDYITNTEILDYFDGKTKYKCIYGFYIEEE